MLHGADYNAEQWPSDVWTEDMRLMKLAHCNAATIGVFSWVKLEPEEGKFTFEWMDRIMDLLHKNGAYAVLATPSGSKPAWMSAKYPEVCSVKRDRQRLLHGFRHNHCITSPVYREKTRIINRKLAERYKGHPALLVWHISNEYSGATDWGGSECHCDLCQEAFRNWLKARYKTLDELNAKWWSTFWSHTFTDWSQIVSPSPRGEISIHGLNIDWKRFVTYQTIDFYKNEIAPIRELTPEVPITTNFMGTYSGLDYSEFAKHLDVISWDSYPQWHSPDGNPKVAANTAFVHDLNRALKGGQPFMLMESTPSATNWMPVCKLKRPGMHALASIQAVAHGSDTVQYFQWRKSRGGMEKFHGAVVDHDSRATTRVFQDVAGLGQVLEGLDAITGTSVAPEVAVIYDWENCWAVEDARGARNDRKDYVATCEAQYRPFWKMGVPVDVIASTFDFSPYKLLIAPMLYMLRPGVAERIEAFVRNGGTFVATYWTGIADESDLCNLGGFPGPLRKVLGILSEEIDALYDADKNAVNVAAGSELGFAGSYAVRELCDLIHAESAKVLATYDSDFYAGRPALTVNESGKGRAYYIASRNEDKFHDDFYGSLAAKLGLERTLKSELPPGVTAQRRTDGGRTFVFVMNFNPHAVDVNLGGDAFTDFQSKARVAADVRMEAYGYLILEKSPS